MILHQLNNDTYVIGVIFYWNNPHDVRRIFGIWILTVLISQDETCVCFMHLKCPVLLFTASILILLFLNRNKQLSASEPQSKNHLILILLFLLLNYNNNSFLDFRLNYFGLIAVWTTDIFKIIKSDNFLVSNISLETKILFWKKNKKTGNSISQRIILGFRKIVQIGIRELSTLEPCVRLCKTRQDEKLVKTKN